MCCYNPLLKSYAHKTPNLNLRKIQSLIAKNSKLHLNFGKQTADDVDCFPQCLQFVENIGDGFDWKKIVSGNYIKLQNF